MFLTTYLNTKYGVLQMLQFASGGLQGHVNKDRISNLQVPLLDITFQQKIEYLILQSHDNLNQSKSLYSEAETLLLQELDLENYEPDSQNIAEVSFSQMLQIGRMDAEYFQPKYAKFIEHIKMGMRL